MYLIAAVILVLLLMNYLKTMEHFNSFILPKVPKRVTYPHQNLDTERVIAPPEPFQTGHVDRILHRKLRAPHEDIASLKPSKTSGLEGCDDVTVSKCSGHRIYHETKDAKKSCLSKRHTLYQQIRNKQPSVYGDTPHVIHRDGHAHYRDWRYPEKPIPAEFLINSGKFCRAHPRRYPCYVQK